MDEEEENLRMILSMATEIRKSWNLFVNEDKTDSIRVYLANSGETDTSGKLVARSEEWRKSTTLGSMLCSKADIQVQRRISLGHAAFKKYKKAWTNKIPLKKRLMLYEALAVSVFMYNYS
jgi:hypothetical protein